MNKNIFIVLLNIYLLLVGLWWISLQIYFRFIAKKSTYDLLEIKLFISPKMLMIFITFTLLHLMIILSILLNTSSF